jgi:glutathione S-transferase
VLLYDSPSSGNCYKVRLLLAHLGLEYERHTVDVVDRSNRRELLGDLNPALRVPTLVLDDGRPLAESDAILMYFGEGTEYLPADRYERAQVLQWLFFEQYSHEPYIAVVRYWLCFAETPPPEEQIEARRAGGRAGVDRAREPAAGARADHRLSARCTTDGARAARSRPPDARLERPDERRTPRASRSTFPGTAR